MEVTKVVIQSVQTAYKPLRASKPILRIHHGIAPPMEIHVNSRLKLTRCNDCTNANCISTESWGCWDVKNVAPKPVQTADKHLRVTKPILPNHCRIAPPMEILVNSRLKLTKCNDCTNKNCYQQKAKGVERLQKWSFNRCKQRTDLYRGLQTYSSDSPRHSAANGNSR